MDQLLKSWQMPEEVVETFLRNGIEPSHLSSLTEENLKELCPLMGVRIDLKKKIAEFLDRLATTDTVTSDSNSLFPGDEINSEFNISLTDILISPQFQDFDLKTLLETSPCGKSILQFYCTNGCLDSKRRNRLTDIIIRHLYTFIVNKLLNYDDYTVLSGKIITLFPQESASTYFTRPIKKKDSNSGKSVPAKGKLIDRVRNILFQSGERKRSTNDDNENVQQQKRNKRRTIETVEDISAEQSKEYYNWLKENQEPWHEVVAKWKATIQIRHDREYNNVAHFIQEWTILNSQKSVQLINEDFELLFPGKKDKFIQNWQPFCRKVFELKKSEIKNDEYKEELLTSISRLVTDEEKIPSELTLLVHLIPPKGRSSQKKKFSTRECLESIMVVINNPGDINQTVEEKKEEARKQREPVQPYLILLGNLQDCKQFYLVVDEIKYSFDSATSAFDTLFKSYQVFNAKYNKSSEHIMLIIQRCIYNITTKYDNPVPYISDVLNLVF